MKPPVIRYSLAFKKKVLDEISSGRFGSIREASEFYGITGSATVRTWMKRLGREDLSRRMVRVQVSDETPKINEMRKRIKELEELVADMALTNHYKQALLQVIARENNCTVDELNKKKDIKL